jgi:hypothetical protein
MSLHFCISLKIPLEMISYVPINHHTTLLPSPTWRRKFFETLFHFEKDLLLMPSSHFEMSSLFIQSLDLLLQALLHREFSFLVIMKTQTTNCQPTLIPLDLKMIF